MISAIVSSATDNAKELILAKINATSKFADIYTLLLNTGMPFKEIAEFMMSPIFNVVNDFITPNMFDSRTKFLKVEDVIKFVLNESSILVNTNTFDNVILHADEGLSDNTSFIMKLIYETNEKGENKMAKFAIMGYGTLGSGLAYVADVNHDSIMEKVATSVTTPDKRLVVV